MPKKTRRVKPIVWMAALLLVFVILAGTYYWSYTKETELKKIYSTFSCTCCESTLLASDDFCALGIKDKIKGLQEQGNHGNALFHETIKLLGQDQIIDQDLRMQSFSLFANTSEPHATMTLSETESNFGNVSESKSPIAMKDFTIKNTGTRDLYIYRVETSCSCLEAKFITGDYESMSYGRFSFPYGATLRLRPDESTRLRVKYDARVNSFFRGHEVRFIYIRSNDVVQPTKQIAIQVIHSD